MIAQLVLQNWRGRESNPISFTSFSTTSSVQCENNRFVHERRRFGLSGCYGESLCTKALLWMAVSHKYRALTGEGTAPHIVAPSVYPGKRTSWPIERGSIFSCVSRRFCKSELTLSEKMNGTTGLEPATCGVTRRRFAARHSDPRTLRVTRSISGECTSSECRFCPDTPTESSVHAQCVWSVASPGPAPHSMCYETVRFHLFYAKVICRDQSVAPAAEMLRNLRINEDLWDT